MYDTLLFHYIPVYVFCLAISMLYKCLLAQWFGYTNRNMMKYEDIYLFIYFIV